MHIPDHLADFRDQDALVIISADKTAKIYLIQNEEINELEHITHEEIHHSDKEERFLSSGQGERFGGGATDDDLDIKERESFTNRLHGFISNYSYSKIDRIYLLGTKWSISKIKEMFPPSTRDKVIVSAKMGNFVNQSPINALEEISIE